ncbi:OLC1v1000498C2 [Oldenlandia corymbosa var. corymbosa]|uniref:OLC1v1000498C2 n=1 Tax=Oldenlandia corymbosa var. corymbosa TaxID=529605 RepID=A0AAV1D409_OLDCO|nr:OLC1v1000498C2 [Oldenlandia corymbosa var. corymbosa]
MASQGRAYPYWAHVGGNNGSIPVDPQQTVLDVTPLNVVPPPHPFSAAASTKETNASASSTGNNSGTSVTELPATVFFTSPPTTEEWNNIMAVTKSGVALTGSAAKGKPGPAIGSIDIFESEDEIIFRVALPGVVRDASVFTCDVQPSGAITIKGKTATGGETVCKDSMVFRMQTQNLSPPGEFSISFRLPVPIDHKQPVKGVFGTDGVFEALVKKRMIG